MCGIAGYNAHPAWVTEFIDEDVQYGMLKDMWLYNQHRGSDAAGYFRVDKQDTQAYVIKAPRPASDILDDQKSKKLSPALVMGAHTRAATLGDPRNNLNNHPIDFKNVLVTHNGVIQNHDTFRAMVPHKDRSEVGEVDSSAIAIALNHVRDPHDIDEVLEVLSDIHGSMAIHAVWKDQPGVSLLAKGKGSPLVMRWHPDGFFCYGSMDDVTYAMIERMGLDPTDKAWEIRRADEFTAVVIENGMPVNWGSYKKSGWNVARNTLDHFVRRIKADNTKDPVFQTDSSTYWAADATNETVKKAKRAKRTKLIFTAEQGYRKEKTKVELPVQATLKPWDKVTEADKVYENTEEAIIYAIFGDIEVVIDSDNSKVLDIYNHEKFPNVVRRMSVPIQKDVQSNDTFDEWVRKATSNIYKPVDELTVPSFQRSQSPNPTRGVTVLTPPKRNSTISNTTKSTDGSATGSREKTRKTATLADLIGPSTVSIDEEDNEPDVFYLHQEVNWGNKGTWADHKTAPMGFLDDRICPDHQQPYSVHTDPTKCDTVVLAAIAWASCVNDLSVWYSVAPGLELTDRPKLVEGMSIQCAGLEGSACTWEPYLWRQVFIGRSNGVDQVVEVLAGEMCSVCGSKFFMRELPKFMEDWTGDKCYVS